MLRKKILVRRWSESSSAGLAGHDQTEPRGDLYKLGVTDRRRRSFTRTELRRDGQKQAGSVTDDQYVEERWNDSHECRGQSVREGTGGRSLNARLITDSRQVSRMIP